MSKSFDAYSPAAFDEALADELPELSLSAFVLAEDEDDADEEDC